MHTTGLVLAIFGGMITFGSILALSCSKTYEKMSGLEAFDIFILGGIISFFRGLFGATVEAIKNRSSATFPSFVLLCIGVGMLGIGCSLMVLAGPN